MGALGRPRFEWAELAGTVGGAWSSPQSALDPVPFTPDDDVGAVELLFDDDLPSQERDHLFGLKHEVVTGASPGNEVGHPPVRRRAHGSTLPPSCSARSAIWPPPSPDPADALDSPVRFPLRVPAHAGSEFRRTGNGTPFPAGILFAREPGSGT